MNSPAHRQPARRAARRLAATLAALLAFPAVLVANPPAAAPAFALPAPAAVEATADLPRHAAAATAHASWREREGGAEYQPTLSFLRGTPVLMLVTAPREPAARVLHRKRAMLQACGFLLAEGAFADAVICVVESDPARPAAPAVRNHPVNRADFGRSLRTEAGVPDVAAALRAARADDALTLRLCAALRID